MPPSNITLRELNRATLARQLLLERSPISIEQALVHLVGLQAQEPHSWYTGLWSRLAEYDPHELAAMLENRAVVRTALMRSTIHLVTAEDAVRLRPTLQAAVARPMQTGQWRRTLERPDAEAIAAAGRALLDESPKTNLELGRALAERWPDAEPSDLGMAVRVWVPLAQVPPRGLWGRSGPARHAPLDSWLRRPLGSAIALEELAVRYLAAFGPATPGDMRAWSGLTGLRDVFERLRPELITLRDERGRELFDLPDAPRPPADTPAPPRFLYDFDNLVLSHADRTRFLPDELRRDLLVRIGGYFYGSLLVDGIVSGIWRIVRSEAESTLNIRLVHPLSPDDEAAVTREADGLLALWTREGEQRRIRFED